jgi:hypothetical protein
MELRVLPSDCCATGATGDTLDCLFSWLVSHPHHCLESKVRSQFRLVAFAFGLGWKLMCRDRHRRMETGDSPLNFQELRERLESCVCFPLSVRVFHKLLMLHSSSFPNDTLGL